MYNRRVRHLNPATAGAIVALDARFITGLADDDPVSTWAALPNSSYSATASLTARPLYKTNIQGGLPALLFDGVNDVMSTTFGDAQTDFTIMVSFKEAGSASAGERILDKNFASGWWLGRNVSGAADSWGGGILQAGAPFGIYGTLSDSRANTLTSIRSGTSHLIFGNGISIVTGTVSSSATDTTTMSIGGVAGGFGSLYEMCIFVWNSALSDSLRRRIEQHVALSFRYSSS